MSTILKLQKTLASNVTTNPIDVLAAKMFLQEQGFFKAPEWGVTEYPDRALFSAIEAFQKSKGLRVDGMMKPEGETETASQLIQTTGLNLQSLGQGGDTILAHITPAEAQLLHNVTDGGSINPKTGLMEFRWGHSSDDNDSQFGEANAGGQSNDQAAENEAQQGADFSGRESSDNMRTVDYVNARRNENNARNIERAETRQAQQREIARQKKAEEDQRKQQKELKAEEDRQRRVAELKKKEEEDDAGLLSKSKKTKDLNYDDLDTENATELADQNARAASDQQAKENESVRQEANNKQQAPARNLLTPRKLEEEYITKKFADILRKLNEGVARKLATTSRVPVPAAQVKTKAYIGRTKGLVDTNTIPDQAYRNQTYNRFNRPYSGGGSVLGSDFKEVKDNLPLN